MGTCLDGLLNHFLYDRDLVPEPVEQATERVEWIRLSSALGRRHPKFKRASKVGPPACGLSGASSFSLLTQEVVTCLCI